MVNHGDIHISGGGKMSKFIKPDFDSGEIELRCESDGVCIYGTEVGIKKIIEFCQKLLDKPQQGHIHLEDYSVLTEDSLRGAIAIFPKGA